MRSPACSIATRPRGVLNARGVFLVPKRPAQPEPTALIWTQTLVLLLSLPPLLLLLQSAYLVPSTITIAAAARLLLLQLLLLQLLLLLVLLLVLPLFIIRSACIHCLYSTGVSLAAAGTTKALLLLLLQPSYFFCDSTALTNASKLLDPSTRKDR